MSEKPYNGLLGLDRLPQWVKMMNLILTWSVMSYVSIVLFLGGYKENTFEILGIYCFGAVWLRLTGNPWIIIGIIFTLLIASPFLIDLIISLAFFALSD